MLCCTGVTWKAQNQAAVLLAAGQKGHRYTFPHAKISTAPPIMNRVFGQSVDAQLQVRFGKRGGVQA
jgi:ATP-dependent protease ClpP protease subunit